MSTTKKVLIIISAIVLLAAFVFAITWGIINWSKVKEGMKGNGLYTQEDIQKSYEDGFNKALSDKDEYEKLINSYKDTITTQNDLISQHTSEVAMLNNSIKDYTEQVKVLSEQRTALETQISTLTEVKTANEKTISELNKQIDNLSNQVVILQGNVTENATQIESLNNQISSLQAINSQLKTTNELNTETITALNNQNTALNNQIAELNQQIQNDFSIVGTLTNKITELEKSVQYYEKYLESITQGELVMATFELNGSVYNVQMVNKNSTISVVQPQSTEYIIFNGWMVDGEMVDLSTYTITENTRFIANIMLKFDIKFFADGENIQSSIMVKDSKITPPEAPIKVGYVFEGWTVDGSLIINFDTYSVNQNVTFTAKYVKQYLVKFEYEGTVISSQTITSGHCAELPEVPNTTYKVFNGWKMNGAIVDVLNYKINANTTFVADITYKYDVKFMVDDEVYNSQIIEKNSYLTEPTEPLKDKHIFIGWTLDSENIVNVSKYIVNESTTFIAKFNQIYDVKFMVDGVVYNSQEVIEGNSISTVENPSKNKYRFLGWAKEDSDTIIDLSNFDVTSDINFVAKFKLMVSKLVDGDKFNDGYYGRRDYIKTVTFDKYSNDNGEYIVNGTNILEGQLFVDVTATDGEYSQVRMYNILDNLYILSDSVIVFNENSDFMLSCLRAATKMTFSNIDTSNVTSMIRMFYDCRAIVSLDLTSFNTSNVTSIGAMFEMCTHLTSVNLSSFDTSKVTSMGNMFEKCSQLTTIDISNFDTRNVTSMNSMFSQCSSATRIYVGSNFLINKVTNSTNMFYDCKKLPNFNSSIVDQSKAHTNSGGYLTFKG